MLWKLLYVIDCFKLSYKPSSFYGLWLNAHPQLPVKLSLHLNFYQNVNLLVKISFGEVYNNKI